MPPEHAGESMTNPDAQEHRDHRFLIGLISGSVLGVGAMVFGPRWIAELRKQAADSARTLGRKAQGVRDDLCDAVAHGAQEVERYATEAKTDPAAKSGAHSAAHPSTSARHA
jgi:gas vesicle protein